MGEEDCFRFGHVVGSCARDIIGHVRKSVLNDDAAANGFIRVLTVGEMMLRFIHGEADIPEG